MNSLTNQPGADQKISLLIADDQELARSGLRSFFMSERTFVIVGEAYDGESTLRLCRELKPQVLLLDIRMGASDGLEVARNIRIECPSTQIIMVTMYDDIHYLIEAMRIGVKGYLLKDAPRSEFLSTTRKVVRGETAFNPQLMAAAIYTLTTTNSDASTHPTVETLTSRELNVLSLIITGQTNRQIAAALGISPGTVKVHVEHIIAKLGVKDRTQAAVRAVELGLVSSPSVP